MEVPGSRPAYSQQRCMGRPLNRNNMDSNQLPEWQAQHRERQRARIQSQARLAYLPKPMPSAGLRCPPNVSRVERPAPPDWNRGDGDCSRN